MPLAWQDFWLSGWQNATLQPTVAKLTLSVPTPTLIVSDSASLAANLTFTGSFTKQTDATLTAGLSFTGQANRQTGYTLTAGLSFVGALVALIGVYLTGALNFTGSLVKGILRSLSGGLNLTGNENRQTDYLLSGIGSIPVLDNFNRAAENPLSDGGQWNTTAGPGTGRMQTNGSQALATTPNVAISSSFWTTPFTPPLEIFADIPVLPSVSTDFVSLPLVVAIGTTPNGYYFRFRAGDFLIQRVTNGSQSRSVASGTMTLNAGDTIAGTYDEIGTLTAWQKTGGVWSALGSGIDTTYLGALYPGLRTNDATAAFDNFGAGVSGATALSFSGLLSKAPSYGLSGGLSFTGIENQQTTRSLSAGLSFIGSLVKSTLRSLSASLSFAGNLIRQASRLLAGGLSFVGQYGPTYIVELEAAMLSFVGALSRSISQILSGALSFSGALAKQTVAFLTANFSFSGSLSRTIPALLTGGLSFAGTIVKQTGVALTGSASFAGNLTRLVSRALSVSLSFSGLISRSASSLLSGALSFVGQHGPTYIMELEAAFLSFVGNVTRQSTQALQATLSFVGALSRLTSHSLNVAVLVLTGSLTRATAHIVSAILSYAGSVSSSHVITQSLSAALSFVGSVTSSHTALMALNASLSFAGEQAKTTLGALTSALNFVGAYGPTAISRALDGTVAFAGSITKGITRTLRAALSFVGNLIGVPTHGSINVTLNPTTGILTLSAGAPHIISVIPSGEAGGGAGGGGLGGNKWRPAFPSHSITLHPSTLRAALWMPWPDVLSIDYQHDEREEEEIVILAMQYLGWIG